MDRSGNKLAALEVAEKGNISHVADNFLVFVLCHPAHGPIAKAFADGIVGPEMFPLRPALGPQAVAYFHGGNARVVVKDG